MTWEKPRVLVVEDHPTNLRLVQEILTRSGYDVVSARNATDGIRIACDENPRLILMDIQLPEMDGLSATRALKADSRTAHIPVIAVTAHAMRGDEARMLEAGCARYIPKPIRYRELLEVVESFCGGSHGRQG